MQVVAECIDWEDDKPIYLLIYSDVTTLVKQYVSLSFFIQEFYQEI
ncbi:TPA: hypothetical protein ACSBVF_003592 [Clostridioides difficile]|nr:putative signaling domain protein [Clostridioides difficile F314]EQI13005.1 putative signaling domain protein [Clostridioides difficile F253]EQJ43542.1 putative signaling domain protein [Clostridioides difficile P23]EQJ83645.1 putative signaling domain protein [Clostridioides difficile P45]EQK09740.1 putative signaling domain protein [Clostridioides difficile P59]EQK90879.1 putative signaling domain protein [Clostridioides difficile P31]MDE3578636.1 hypothetical protein [Clostridioides dif